MKSLRYFLPTLISCLLINNNLFSQDWHTNGNFVVPGQFLGSTNNEDLRIRVNNYPRLRIVSTTGFVGIGISALPRPRFYTLTSQVNITPTGT